MWLPSVFVGLMMCCDRGYLHATRARHQKPLTQLNSYPDWILYPLSSLLRNLHDLRATFQHLQSSLRNLVHRSRSLPQTSAPATPSVAPIGAEKLSCCGTTSIPLQFASSPHLVRAPLIKAAIHTLMACIQLCVLMITMHIATTHAGEARYAQRKKQRR